MKVRVGSVAAGMTAAAIIAYRQGLTLADVRASLAQAADGRQIRIVSPTSP